MVLQDSYGVIWDIMANFVRQYKVFLKGLKSSVQLGFKVVISSFNEKIYQTLLKADLGMIFSNLAIKE